MSTNMTVIVFPNHVARLTGICVVRIGVRRVKVELGSGRIDWFPRKLLPETLPEESMELAMKFEELRKRYPDGWQR